MEIREDSFGKKAVDKIVAEWVVRPLAEQARYASTPPFDNRKIIYLPPKPQLNCFYL